MPNQKTLDSIASQTIGPFFHNGLKWDAASLASSETAGRKSITLYGSVRDGAGEPVADCMLEVWVAEPNGAFSTAQNGNHRAHGLARAATDAKGVYRFNFSEPVSVDFGGKACAPHVNIIIFARGLLTPLFTRMFFADTYEKYSEDPIITAIAPRKRVATLVAQKVGDRAYEWNIHLQGELETVFLSRSE